MDNLNNLTPGALLLLLPLLMPRSAIVRSRRGGCSRHGCFYTCLRPQQALSGLSAWQQSIVIHVRRTSLILSSSREAADADAVADAAEEASRFDQEWQATAQRALPGAGRTRTSTYGDYTTPFTHYRTHPVPKPRPPPLH